MGSVDWNLVAAIVALFLFALLFAIIYSPRETDMDYRIKQIHRDTDRKTAAPKFEPFYAIGRFTQSLYLMFAPNHGVCLVPKGKAIRDGFKFGTHCYRESSAFIRVPHGSVIEIELPHLGYAADAGMVKESRDAADHD